MRHLKKNRITSSLAALLLAGLLTACGVGGDAPSPDSPDAAGQPLYSLTREDARTEPKSPTAIDLGSAGGELLITEPGDYLLSGSMKGCIRIRAEEQVVHLFLSGVNVRANATPALWVESAGKVVLTACDGTENEFLDGSGFTDDDCDACVFSGCDMTLNGSGRVSVTGRCKDAIHTKDTLKISGLTLDAHAKRDGLRGNDGVMIADARVSVQAEESGIHTTRSAKAWKGSIEITGSEVSVIAGTHALDASRDITVTSGKLFLKGVMSNSRANGEISMEEGCLVNE